MLKFKPIFFLFIFPAFLLSASAGATDTMTNQVKVASQYVSDATITTDVKSDFLLDNDIKSLSISVTTNHGIVTLSGNVENAMQKRQAVKVARHVKGVKAVKDELVIKRINKK